MVTLTKKQLNEWLANRRTWALGHASAIQDLQDQADELEEDSDTIEVESNPNGPPPPPPGGN